MAQNLVCVRQPARHSLVCQKAFKHGECERAWTTCIECSAQMTGSQYWHTAKTFHKHAAAARGCVTQRRTSRQPACQASSIAKALEDISKAGQGRAGQGRAGQGRAPYQANSLVKATRQKHRRLSRIPHNRLHLVLMMIQGGTALLCCQIPHLHSGVG